MRNLHSHVHVRMNPQPVTQRPHHVLDAAGLCAARSQGDIRDSAKRSVFRGQLADAARWHHDLRFTVYCRAHRIRDGQLEAVPLCDSLLQLVWPMPFAPPGAGAKGSGRFTDGLPGATAALSPAGAMTTTPPKVPPTGRPKRGAHGSQNASDCRCSAGMASLKVPTIVRMPRSEPVAPLSAAACCDSATHAWAWGMGPHPGCFVSVACVGGDSRIWHPVDSSEGVETFQFIGIDSSSETGVVACVTAGVASPEPCWSVKGGHPPCTCQ